VGGQELVDEIAVARVDLDRVEAGPLRALCGRCEAADDAEDLGLEASRESRA
jgi:hypothetical protein